MPFRSHFVHKDKVQTICFEPNKNNVITGARDGSVCMWSPQIKVSSLPLSDLSLPPLFQPLWGVADERFFWVPFDLNSPGSLASCETRHVRIFSNVHGVSSKIQFIIDFGKGLE